MGHPPLTGPGKLIIVVYFELLHHAGIVDMGPSPQHLELMLNVPHFFIKQAAWVVLDAQGRYRVNQQCIHGGKPTALSVNHSFAAPGFEEEAPSWLWTMLQPP